MHLTQKRKKFNIWLASSIMAYCLPRIWHCLKYKYNIRSQIFFPQTAPKSEPIVMWQMVLTQTRKYIFFHKKINQKTNLDKWFPIIHPTPNCIIHAWTNRNKSITTPYASYISIIAYHAMSIVNSPCDDDLWVRLRANVPGPSSDWPLLL